MTDIFDISWMAKYPDSVPQTVWNGSNREHYCPKCECVVEIVWRESGACPECGNIYYWHYGKFGEDDKEYNGAAIHWEEDWKDEF